MAGLTRGLLLAAAGIALAGFAGATSASAQGIIAKDAKWEKVSSAGKAFGEGVVAGKDGGIYVVDLLPPGVIYRYDPKSGETTETMKPSNLANGLYVDKNGDLLINEANGIYRRNLKTGETKLVVDKYQGKQLIGPNDLTMDAKGRIYFTDARFNQTEEPVLPNAIYRLDPDGKLTQLNTDLTRPNGIEISPDGKKLYVADSAATRLKPNPVGPASDKFGITKGGVVVYDIKADGSIANGKVIYKSDAVMPDGMTMDTKGTLYIAAHDKPNRQIAAMDSTGKIIQEFPLPDETSLTVQLGFGRGKDAGSLYLSTGGPWGLWRIKTTRTGFYRFK